MLTGLLIIVPLIAAFLVFFLKGKNARIAALGFSVVEFALSVFAWYQFKSDPLSKQLYLNCTWIESLGVNFAVGLDGMSLLMVLLTTFLVPIIILSSFKNDYEKPNAFYGLMLVM